MRVIISLVRFLPGKTLGGETYLTGLAKGFQALGLADRLYLVCGRDAELWLRQAFRGAVIRAVQLPKGVVTRALAEQGIVRSFAGRWAATGVFFPFNISCGTREPTVVMVHDLADRYYCQLSRGYRRFRSAVRLALVRRSVKAATRVVVPSEAVARELEALTWVPRERVVVIPEAPAAARPRGLARCWDGSEPYLLLQAGAYSPHKNAELSVAALAVLRRSHPNVFAKVRLVITGAAARWRALESLAWHAGVASNVSIYPRLPLERFEELLGKAVAVVVPSKYEGFGLPIVEAQAHGIPVLAADIPALREVSGGVALFFHPENPEALAMRIVEVLSGDSLRESLVRAGFQRVGAWSWVDHVRYLWRTFGEAFEEKTLLGSLERTSAT